MNINIYKLIYKRVKIKNQAWKCWPSLCAPRAWMQYIHSKEKGLVLSQEHGPSMKRADQFVNICQHHAVVGCLN